jgi:hypothetical protein
MRKIHAAGILLAAGLALGAAGAPAGDDRILWYYDGDTALRAAAASGKPVVILKIRADVGKDVKT